MNIETNQTGNFAVVAVSGRIDSSNAKDLDEGLAAVIDEGANQLVVDCSDLSYMSSAGLRALLIAIKKTNGAGGALALAQVASHILEVLEVSGFTRLAKVYDTVEEARASF